MSDSKNSTLLPLIVAILAIGLGLFFATKTDRTDSKDLKLEKAIVLPNPKTLTSFDLIDGNNQTFNNDSIKGKWSILFFGFTYCPDICPTTMNTLKQVKAQLQQQGLWQHFRVVLVSVDPARDTPERLKEYVDFFDTEFMGVTGKEPIIKSFAKELGILYIKGETKDNGSYDVDHSASIILINPEGKMAGVISPPHQIDQITHDLAEIATAFGSNASEPSKPSAEKPKAVVTQQANDNDQTDTQGLLVSNAWVRPAPGGSTAMAGYLTLDNRSNTDITLVSADSPQFGHVMIHATEFEDNIAKMVHLDSLSIVAGGSVELKPLSTHLMLMMPKQKLNIGDQVEVSLTDKQGNVYPVSLTIKNQTSSD